MRRLLTSLAFMLMLSACLAPSLLADNNNNKDDKKDKKKGHQPVVIIIYLPPWSPVIREVSLQDTVDAYEQVVEVRTEAL